MRKQLLDHIVWNELRISGDLGCALGDEVRAADGTGDRHFEDDPVFPGPVLGYAAVDPDAVRSHRFDFPDVSKAYRRRTMCGRIPVAHFRHSPAFSQCRYLNAAYEFLTRTILSEREDSLTRRDVFQNEALNGRRYTQFPCAQPLSDHAPVASSSFFLSSDQ
jgi:hypothetical protein